MITTQEKIDEIYDILKKTESRRKRHLFLSFAWKILWLSLLVLVIFFPTKIFSGAYDIIAPMIQNTVKETLEEQKEKLLHSATSKGTEIYNKAQESLKNINF